MKLEVCGGCNAKIGAENLDEILKSLDIYRRPEIIVGFEGKDDGAVIKLTDDIAIINTLDFFPAMVEEPATFGEIAAANALSDIYAMGGEVVAALNIVCFPEEEDSSILQEILQGGARKVKEAEGSLIGGHSIHDKRIKYGMSVTGVVHPDKIWKNTGSKVGDEIFITKKLGVSLICGGYLQGEVDKSCYEEAKESMVTLNKYAADILRKFNPTSVTDVTGFGFLGHLKEMVEGKGALIYKDQVPMISGALKAAGDFLFTAGGQRNRNSLKNDVKFDFDDFRYEEVLFDPQTSGGLMFTLDPADSQEVMREFRDKGVFLKRVGVITDKNIIEVK
ncbi:selenide, water dikinase SelD [uncultured Peptoniphilus sp.]|uniref:selenide, water dikinase SelD n=1 Tax=uncultured Peptoniphilus sp. TaxID=254354 RepID=UPI002803CAFF|nr:selenide, water dikinase SelD [uncultured Peptoniphilus sp.]